MSLFQIGAMLIFLLALSAVLYILHLLLPYLDYYKVASRLPYAKGLPIIGLALELWVEKDELLGKIDGLLNKPENKKKLNKQGTLAVWLGPVALVLISKLEDIEQIWTTRHLTKKGYQYRFLEPWLGKGSITSSGPHWERHRKLTTPAFHFKVLRKFLPTFNANIQTYLGRLDEKVGKGSFDIESYITTLSLDIISETAMSLKMNAQKQETVHAGIIRDLTEAVAMRGFRILLYPDIIFNNSFLGRKQKQDLRTLGDCINHIIKNKKEERSINQKIKDDKPNTDSDLAGKEGKALLDLLLETQSESQNISDQDIFDEVNTFLFAGHDTIANGVNFTLYLLSRHPEIQEEVLREVESLVGDEEFTLRNLQALNYLERVIKESLRLYPPIPFILRSLNQDAKLKSGYVLPAGCTIAILVYFHHRNPEWFPDPEKFDPDRFLPENSRKRSPYAFMPFSVGYRNCIGQKFAYLEMKAIIAATVRRYRILPSVDIQVAATISLRSANGINLILERRTAQSADRPTPEDHA